MGKRILVADDSVTIQRAFAMVFSVEAVSLLAARSWDEALSSARQNRPDLIIADVHLGDRSGYDLCAAIKADRSLAGIPVHVLASNQVPYDAGRGNQAGADGHLLKPFDSVKLLEAVSKILGQSVSVPITVVPQPGAPVAVPEENTSRVQIEDISFEDEDSYGEFSIEPTANSAAPPAEKTPPPQFQAPAPARLATPLASRPMPITPAPVVAAPPPRPAMPAAPPPRPAPPIVSAPLARAVVAPVPVAPSMPQAPAPVVAAPVVNSSPTAKSMPRPSLIPGVMPPRTSQDAPVPLARITVASIPAPAPAEFGRTMMGIPAFGRQIAPVAVPIPAARAESATARQTPAVKGLDPSLFDDLIPSVPSKIVESPLVTPPPVAAKVAELVSSKLADKMAEISARGPEYEAIAKLSREIIEQIVWEVVPELAEVMIQEQIDRLAKR